jgi:flagellar biogenesis protein FliO
VYPSDKKIDMMLSFDAKYSGKVSKYKSDSIVKIKLFDLKISKSISENINSSIIKKFQIIPLEDRVEILIETKTNVNIDISKTVDESSIRVELSEKKELKLKEDNMIDYERYFIVMGILFIIVIVLLYFKKQVENGQISWIKKNSDNLPKDLEIVFQKPVDIKNKIILISFKNKEYLVFVSPNSTILLDDFNISKKDDFEAILKETEKLKKEG